MMLHAVVTTVDHRDADVHHLVQTPVERAPYAGVKRQNGLQHIRPVSHQLLKTARLAFHCLLIDLTHLGRSLLHFDIR